MTAASELVLLANHEMVSLVPNDWLADSSSATTILHIVCPNLVRLDANLRIRPDLATSWQVSAGHRRFQFELRPDVVMHTGQALDAELVAWNLARMTDRRRGSLLAMDYPPVATIEVLSRHSLAITFADPFPSFLHHLGGRSYLTTDTIDQPVGAGRYRVDEWARGESLRLTRFDGYGFSDDGCPETITVRWAPSVAERSEAIRAGAADIVESVPTSLLASIAGESRYTVGRTPGWRRSSVVFNCRRAPFDDVRVRQAIALAIDRTELVHDLFSIYARPVVGAYPEGDPLWGADFAPRRSDLTRARELLAEAGVRPGLRAHVATTRVAPMPTVADWVAKRLEPLGIELEVQSFDDPPWWPLVYLAADWDIAFQGMGARPHPDVLFGREYHSRGSFNATGHVSAQLDAVIAQSKREPDVTVQRQLYNEAQRILDSEAPSIPLYCPDSVIAWRADLDGMTAHPLGYIDLNSVRIRAA
jgi:ABC-type transport system substrate-binding protein